LPIGSVSGELRNLKMGAGFDGTRNRAQRDKKCRAGRMEDGNGGLIPDGVNNRGEKQAGSLRGQ
jgi:hypothetical protein